MASTKYTFSKTVNAARLDAEIRASSSITTAIDYITARATDVDVWFKAALSAEEETALDALVTAHVNTPLTDAPAPTNSRGEPVVEMTLRVGKPGTRPMSVCTPPLNDKTTWYQRSVRVTGGALTDAGDQLNYSANAPWINIRHPALFYNEFNVPLRTGGFGKHEDYDVKIYKNGVVQTSGFTVDYKTGKVTFDAPLDPADVVTADYNHLNGVARASEWLLVPPPGYKFVVEHVEIQVSADLPAFQDVLRFEIWAGLTTGTPKGVNVAGYDATGWVDAAFGDPRYPPGSGGGYGQVRSRYRNVRDMLNACNEGQNAVYAIGGLAQEVVILPFNYLQAWVLDSAVGALFRLKCEGDSPIVPGTVEIVTATFYIQLSPSDK